MGILLVGLGSLRFIEVFFDSLGYFMTFAGFLLLTIFMRFAEKEFGLKGTKELWIIKIVFMAVFIAAALWLYIPLA